MKAIKLIFILVISLFISCEKKDTICHEENTKEALKLELIESVNKQSKYIAEKYGIKNVERKMQNLFNSEILLENVYFHGNVSKNDSEQVCTCGIKLSFSNNDQFINYIGPVVLKQMKNNDKYSSEYLKEEHLIKFYTNKEYNFFFSVVKNESNVTAYPIDYKVVSLLIDYLEFSQSK